MIELIKQRGVALLLGMAGFGLIGLGLTQQAHAGAVLDHVRSAGVLTCGVLDEPQDYGIDDTHGDLSDLGGDLCRATAAALLGDAAKIRIAALPNQQHGFAAVQDGRIDLLLGATPSTTAALRWGVAFTGPVFLDGAALLAPRTSGARSLDDLAGKQVCFIGNTVAEAALTVAAARHKIKVLPFPFEEDGEMEAALVTGHCAALIDSASRLGVARAGFHGRISNFAVLPGYYTLDPMAPAMKAGDAEWAAVVGAVTDSLLIAEQAGVTAATASSITNSTDLALRPISGGVPGLPAGVLDRAWASRVIHAVGNYAEVFDRDCGPESELGLDRGPNALWDRGGMLYPQVLHP